jgi:hypothetical protein
VTDADIEALIADTEGRHAQLDALSALVIKGAREMTSEGEMSAATFAALSGHLPNEHLVDLIMTVAFYNGVVRVLGSLQIDVEPDYQPYLARYPLPPKSA